MLTHPFARFFRCQCSRCNLFLVFYWMPNLIAEDKKMNPSGPCICGYQRKSGQVCILQSSCLACLKDAEKEYLKTGCWSLLNESVEQNREHISNT